MQLLVTGRVQGVFYRSTAKRIAQGLKLKGYVKNNEDSSVSIVAEGDEAILEELLKWCHQGPENAEVKDIDVKYEVVTGKYPDFSIKY